MEGLNNQDIDYRISNNLINNEDIKNSRSIKEIFLSNLINLFNFIHIVLFIFVLTTGSITNATFMFAICFNIIISIYQEIKAKKIIDKLKIANQDKVKVIRNIELLEITPDKILLDDLLYLSQGDSLLVDAKIIKADNLEVDESIITGEADAIIKKEDDKVISGSVIISGTGYAKVISINRDTYANKLIKEASKTKDDSSYLMHQINNILKVVTFLIIPVGILLFITQFRSGEGYASSVLSSVAGIIGMIPDGLVLLTSISLTVGVIKMASKKVIIQKLSGIELLACVDILCLGKTGTITNGTMEVIDIINIDRRTNMENILKGMANIEGNATDKAIYNKFGNDSTLKLVSRIPFSSARKYALSVFNDGIYALGALEYMTNRETKEFSELDEYLANGYRILTLVDCGSKFDKESNRVIGFVILKDNIRSNAKETLDYFDKQGVKVKIISGDNLLKQIDIPNYDKYIDGSKLGDDYNKIKSIVNDYIIFGRVTPYQKQLIVKSLREKATVGYIGDGVNDILALKHADCSIAMASGAEAAKNISHIVLLDSNFDHLPMVVQQGRRVVNNLQRTASLFLVKTSFAMILSIIFMIGGLINKEASYPFETNHLYIWELASIGVASLFLTLEPNVDRLRGTFLRNVFSKALPAAATMIVGVAIIFGLYHLNKYNAMYTGIYSKEAAIVMSSIIFTVIAWSFLLKICRPFTLYRGIVFGVCTLVTFGGLTAAALISMFAPAEINIFPYAFKEMNPVNYCVTGIVLVSLVTLYLAITYIVEVLKGESKNVDN